MEFLFFIGAIAVLFLVFNLRGRVKKLEQIVKSNLEKAALGSSHGEVPNQPSPEQPLTTAQLLDHTKRQLKQGAEEVEGVLVSKGRALSDAVAWLKEEWLMKLGAMLLLIGFGWLTTYAFLNNWIGPMGRIGLGIAAGVLFLLVGWWRIKKYVHQGGVFLVLGSTTILLTIFAAREVYDFFTPISALTVMFLSTAFVALASVRYNNRALALASLILASIAPLLTNASATDYIGLFAYLFVVILGAIWFAVLTGRRELTAAALVMITLYSLPHLLYQTSADKGMLLLFSYAFTAVFFITNTNGILKSKGKKITYDLVTAAGNGLFLLSWIMVAAQDEWKSLIISAWMTVFVVGAFSIFKATQRREPFYVYAGVGVAMLAAATSAELKGAALTIAYTIETGIIPLIVYTLLRGIKIAGRISLLLMGPVILSTDSIMSDVWLVNVIHKEFFVLLVLTLTFLGLGMFFFHRTKEGEDKELKQLGAIFLVVGSAYAYILLWLSLQAGLSNDNTAVMISLVVYTIIGLVCYFYGLSKENKWLRLYGGVLVGLVVGRLLLVDVWRMDLTGRISTFFLIGTLLVSTAFLGRNKQNKSLPDTT